MKMAINRAKTDLERLQMQGATLKRIARPSDDPVSNVQAMSISSANSDNTQYQRNIVHAVNMLNTTDQSVEQLVEILNKAKEIAIAQSSDFYDKNIRSNIANEVTQLRNAALTIANKRIGNKYMFAGHKTLTRPFASDGTYKGNNGHIHLEVTKDFFIPINLHGEEVFYGTGFKQNRKEHPLNEFPAINNQSSEEYIKDEENNKDGVIDVGRDLASMERIPDDAGSKELGDAENSNFQTRNNMFSLLSSLATALDNDDPDHIQDLLEKFDDSVSRLITLRTRIGSVMNSVLHSRNALESETIDNKERRSRLIDADIAEVFSDLTKHQDVLQTTYQASKALLNQNLLTFLR